MVGDGHECCMSCSNTIVSHASRAFDERSTDVYGHQEYSSVWPPTCMVIVGKWHEFLNMIEVERRFEAFFCRPDEPHPSSQGCAVEI